uniref:Uncharacterized protein n=1 Tax=Arundo donax TaxID=35708 RepID=A0A0A9BXP9_ARUDO
MESESPHIDQNKNEVPVTVLLKRSKENYNKPTLQVLFSS